MGVAIFAETIAVVTEAPVIERRQHLCQRLLNHAIQHRRHAQRTLRPVGLRDEHPAHRRRTIRPLHERGAYPWPVLPAKCRKRLDGHPVDSGSPCVGLDSSPCLQQVLPLQDLLHHGITPERPHASLVAALDAPSPSLASAGASSSTRSERSFPVRPFAPPAFTGFLATTASADSPVRLPSPEPPQVRCALVATPFRSVATLRVARLGFASAPGTTAAFTSTTEPATSLCCATSSHRGRPFYAVLVHRPAGFL